MSRAGQVSSLNDYPVRADVWFRAKWGAPVVVLSLALILRAGAIGYWQFRGLYGQDAYAYYDYSVALRAALLKSQPIPSFFWPPAYPMVFVLASTLVGVNPFAGQMVSLLAGVLAVLCSWLTAQEIARMAGLGKKRVVWVACIAALFLAFSAELIQYSIIVMADSLGLALAVASAWMLARYAREDAPRFLYVSAALLGVAFLARIQMALLIFPWIGCTLFVWKRGRPGTDFAKRALRDGAIAGGIGLAIATPYLLWAWWNAQLGFPSYAANPGFAQWSPLNFLRRDFMTPDGHLQFPYPSGIYYAVAALRGGALTPLVIPFFLLGVWQLWQWRATGALVLLLGWAAAIYLFIAGMPWQNLRFAFPLYPPLAITAAFGVVACGAIVEGWRWFARIGQSRLLAIGVAAFLVVQFALGYVELDKFMRTSREYLGIAEWLKRELPSDATLVTFTVSEMLEHETALNVVEIFFETPDTLTTRLSGSHNYLLIDIASVETQWAGRAPALNYEFLRDRVGLEEMGTRLTFTLYHIKP